MTNEQEGAFWISFVVSIIFQAVVFGVLDIGSNLLPANVSVYVGVVFLALMMSVIMGISHVIESKKGLFMNRSQTFYITAGVLFELTALCVLMGAFSSALRLMWRKK